MGGIVWSKQETGEIACLLLEFCVLDIREAEYLWITPEHVPIAVR